MAGDASTIVDGPRFASWDPGGTIGERASVYCIDGGVGSPRDA